MANDSLPTYAQLSGREDAPRGSNWGLFGKDDQLGTINFLTPERAAAATRLVRKGAVFPLDLPLHLPDPPLFNRGRYVHHITGGQAENRLGHDDHLHNFYLQASSQWDSLAHVGHPRHGLYNGVRAEEVTGVDGSKNGVDAWAERGIAGRGVLLDVARYLASRGEAIDAMTSRAITVGELDATAAQGVVIEPGSVLLVRTGWEEMYLRSDAPARERIASDLRAPGLEGSIEMAAWLWDHRVAAVASDCPALEPWPWDPQRGVLHVRALCFLGMPFGERGLRVLLHVGAAAPARRDRLAAERAGDQMTVDEQCSGALFGRHGRGLRMGRRRPDRRLYERVALDNKEPGRRS